MARIPRKVWKSLARWRRVTAVFYMTSGTYLSIACPLILFDFYLVALAFVGGAAVQALGAFVIGKLTDAYAMRLIEEYRVNDAGELELEE